MSERRDDWMVDAACRGQEAELFMGRRWRAGKRICNRCPVAEACLWFALVEEDSTGLWGGLTASQRARLLTEVGHRQALRNLDEERAFWRSHRDAGPQDFGPAGAVGDG